MALTGASISDHVAVDELTWSFLWLAGAQAFIRIQGGTFVDENCKEFFFSGYNTWQARSLLSSVLILT